MAGRREQGTEGISREALLKRAGIGAIAAGALGPSAALGRGATGQGGKPLTPRRGAREIRRLITGKELFDASDPKSDVWRIHRMLADPQRGPATIRHLDRMNRPAGIDPEGEAIPKGSIPQDRISAAKFWWGYSVYFPHDPLINEIVVYIQDQQFQQLVSALQAALTLIDMGWVVTALKAYVTLEITLLVALDRANNDGGAQLNATWPSPYTFVPTEMKS